MKKENNNYETYKYSINNAFWELTRPRGDYELMFTIKNNINKYKKYFKYNFKDNNILWETMKEEYLVYSNNKTLYKLFFNFFYI